MRFFLFLALVGPLAAQTPPTDLIYGHYEIHIDYQLTPGNPDAGWRFSVSYDGDNDFSSSADVVRMDPAQTVIVASPVTRTAVPANNATFARFGPAGSPLWILPQQFTIAAPFLGVRATLPSGVFQSRVGQNYMPSALGSIGLALVSVEGPGRDAGGHFAVWDSQTLPVQFPWDTTDGITVADEISTVAAASHTHYNWAFTRPGLYRVRLRGMGRLNPQHGGQLTSGEQTFHFSVPFSSVAGDGDALRLWDAGAAGPSLAVAEPGEGALYATDQVFWHVTRSAGSATASFPGAAWETSAVVTPGGPAFSSGVGVDAAAVSAGLAPGTWSDLAVHVLRVDGPGHFGVVDAGGALLANSADGLGAGDAFGVPSGGRNVSFAFTTPGLQRVWWRVTGRRNGVMVTGPERMMVFGVNQAAGFSYAEWQSSFERSAGLAPGALADPEGDWDGDGLAQAAEFALFWHGLSPVRSDADRQPGARPTPEGYAAFDFLRDTWMDLLNESRWEIVAAASPDLQSWTSRSPRVPGFPLGTFETGARLGNSHGRVLDRRLRVMPGPFPRHFFRLQVSPP